MLIDYSNKNSYIFDNEAIHRNQNESEVIEKNSFSENNTLEITVDTIQSLFKKNFDDNISKYRDQFIDNNSTEYEMIKNCELKFQRSRLLDNKKGKFEFQINACLHLNNEDWQKNKKKFDKEIGFFNFKLIDLNSENGKKLARISYFAEVQLEECFQGCKASQLFINSYISTLNDLDVDIDYLHVLSQKEYTAKLYKNKGYEFTNEALEIISEQFEDVNTYLEDSSVSYSNSTTIEMYRLVSHKWSHLPANSIKELENNLNK